MGNTARRWSYVAVVVGVIVLVMGTAWAEKRNTSTGDTPAFELPMAVAPTAPFGVAYLGDSYTAGAGAGNSDEGFANVLSRRMCWDGTNFGVGGTGYTAPGPDGAGPFVQRVDSVIKSNPALVIVQGSTNDRGGANTTAAAENVFSRLREGLPDATIVVMGPLLLKGVSNTVATADRNAVRAAAVQTGLLFIDPIKERWLQDDPSYIAGSGRFPSKAGHAKIADLLISGLRAARVEVPECPTASS